MAQMTDRQATHISELDSLQMRPQGLTRIQFRGIGGQALHVKPLRRPSCEKLLDGVTAVDRRAIPDDHHGAGHLAQQVFEKANHVVRIDRAVLAAEVQLALKRDRGKRRQMVAGPSLPQDRGLAHRGIRADHTGQGIETRFVYEKDALPLGLCPLLSAGQVSCRQQAMADSSRCRARRAGFCGLHRSALSKRPTWTGW
jgi:hypothetical protein